jgi:hypothetical protein
VSPGVAWRRWKSKLHAGPHVLAGFLGNPGKIVGREEGGTGETGAGC